MPEQAFSAQVSEWVAETQQRITAVFRESSERVIEIMQTPVAAGGNMPVLTGFLRASLRVTKDSPAVADQDNPDPTGSFAYSDAAVSLSIAGIVPAEMLYACYTASYAAAVNYGRSGRPGHQFIGLSAQQWPAIVAQVCTELQSRSSGASTPST